MDKSFIAKNALATERLRKLVAQASDEELGLEMEEKWTVAATLAHLAFWDQRALVLIRRWKRSGVGRSAIDIDATNDAILPLCRAIPPRAAAQLALRAAEAIDHELENLSPQLLAEVEGLGSKFRLRRAEHRSEHLEQIETFFQKAHRGQISGSPG